MNEEEVLLHGYAHCLPCPFICHFFLPVCMCVCVCVFVWDVCVHTQTPDIYRYIVKKLDIVIKP
jgi:hypothetical protein